MSAATTAQLARLQADADFFIDLAILAADDNDRDAKRTFLAQAENAVAKANALRSRSAR